MEPLQMPKTTDNEIHSLDPFSEACDLPTPQNAWGESSDRHMWRSWQMGIPDKGSSRHSEVQGGHAHPSSGSEDLQGHVWKVLGGTPFSPRFRTHGGLNLWALNLLIKRMQGNLCYLVLNHFPLTKYISRIPNSNMGLTCFSRVCTELSSNSGF